MKMHQLTLLSILTLLGLFVEQVYANGILSIDAPNHGLRNAEYTTTHLFIDEVAETTAEVEIIYDLSQYANITDVEIFSNVNHMIVDSRHEVFSDLNKYFLVPSLLICLLMICGREIENSLDSKFLNSFDRLVI